MSGAADVGLSVVVAHVAVHDRLGLRGGFVGAANLGVVDGDRPAVISIRKRENARVHHEQQTEDGQEMGAGGGEEQGEFGKFTGSGFRLCLRVNEHSETAGGRGRGLFGHVRVAERQQRRQNRQLRLGFCVGRRVRACACCTTANKSDSTRDRQLLASNKRRRMARRGMVHQSTNVGVH